MIDDGGEYQPPGMEVGAACAWAILAPLLGVSIVLSFGAPGGIGILLFPAVLFYVFIFGSLIAMAHVFCVWVPAWLLLSRWREPGPFAALALGAVCGALPVTLISWFSGWSDGVVAVATIFGGCGIVGGGAFWFRLNRDRL